MEIYKDLTNPASKEFEKLLNSKLSKIQIEEGKIIDGKINKITDIFVFLFVEGLKSEPVLDINELKSMGLGEKIKLGFNYITFAKEIIKNSKVKLFLVNDKNQLAQFLKNNMFGKKIVIGMGAGTISSWMRELPKLL